MQRWWQRRQRQLKRQWLSVIAILITLLPVIGYGVLLSRRPPLEPLTQQLFQGVTYERRILTEPRPIAVHLFTIDLTTPDLRVVVSPGVTTDPDDANFGAAIAQTTSQFLETSGAQVAMNGSFFFPFREEAPWDYEPRSGQIAQALGHTIANGAAYAKAREDWYPLCILDTPIPPFVVLADNPTCPPNTEFSLAGLPRLLVDGEPMSLEDIGIGGALAAYPRVVAAVNEPGTVLWLIAVDGKQLFYSEGITLTEITELARSLGATTATNLDGGGSTTVAMATPTGAKVLNVPTQTRLPGRERPVVNHIGVFAPPLAEN